MIPLALFTLVAVAGYGDASANQILDRFVQFKKSNPKYQAAYTARTGSFTLNCDVKVDARQRLLFTAIFNGAKYSLSETPDGVKEQNSAMKEYEDFPFPGRTFKPSSRISAAPKVILPWVFANDLRVFIPKSAAFEATGSSKVQGVSCDHIRAAFKTPSGTGAVDVDIAKDGRPMALKMVSDGQEGHSDFEFDITRFGVVKSFASNSFALPIPLGFTPFSVPATYDSLRMGQSVPLIGWKAATGNATLKDALGPAKTLLFIQGEDSTPNRNGQAALADLRKIVPVVVIADSASTGDAQFFDPSHKLINKIDPPATPYFLLIDRNGKIEKIWMGIDPENLRAFEAEVSAACAG